MTGSKAKANGTNGSAHGIQKQGFELFKSLKDVLDQLGLTDDDYAALKKAPCRERDQTDRLADLIARLKNRGAGIQASSYDLERILGTNDLVGVEYLTRGVRAAAAVGRVLIRDESDNTSGYASGFMVSPRLLLTNRHVLPDKETAAASMVEFGYEKDERGIAKLQTQVYRLDPTAAYFVGDTDDLDFAFCAVAPEEQRGTAGAYLSQWGYLRLDKQLGKVAELEYVTIIQHPGGDYKQVALRENKVLSKKSPTVLLYQSDTAPGSSGSPVFNDQWQVVALHSRGVKKAAGGANGVAKTSTAPAGGQYEANLGVRISAIVNFLESDAEAKKNLLVHAFLSDLQLGGLPVASVEEAAEGIDALERARKKRGAPGQGGRRVALAREEQLALQSRTGYDPDFLGVTILLPDSTAAQKKFGPPVTVGGDAVLNYMHFSLELSSERKLAYWTAVNIDGATAASPARAPKFRLDPRLKEGEQSGDELYTENVNYFDRGHMVRRKDPSWGDSYEYNAGNLDSMYFTNIAPQYYKVNQGDQLWAGLEDYVLNNATNDGLKISVFTGPVFKQDDAVHRGVQIPGKFWKVVALVHNGVVRSSAYVVSQEKFVTAEALAGIDEEVEPLGNILGFQVSVASLQKQIGIDFGPDIVSGDAFKKGAAAVKVSKKGPRGKKEATAVDEESLEAVDVAALGDHKLLTSLKDIDL